MTELEDRLRASLDRDVLGAPLVQRAPAGLRRRVRRRQAVFAVVAGGTALAVALVAVVAIGHFPSGGNRVPGTQIPSIPPPAPAAALPWSTSGSAHVATGQDYGIAWTIRSSGNGTVSVRAGSVSLAIAPGTSGLVDGDGNSLAFASTPATINRVDVVRSDGTVFHGRWMPAVGGHERIWLVGLPGQGHGFEVQGAGTPMATSWPPGSTTPGSVLDAGTDATGVSWWLGFPDPSPSPYCLALQTIQGGSTGCLTAGIGAEVLDSHVTSSAATVVAMTVPANVTYVKATTSKRRVVVTSCDPAPAPAPAEWSARRVCALPLFPLQGTATLRFYDGSSGGSTKDFPQVLHAMQLTWSPGSFQMTPTGLYPSPSPSPSSPHAGQRRPAHRSVEDALRFIQDHVDTVVMLPAGLPHPIRLAKKGAVHCFADLRGKTCQLNLEVGPGHKHAGGGYASIFIQYGWAAFDGCGADSAKVTSVGGVPALYLSGPGWTDLIWPATPKRTQGHYGLSTPYSLQETLRLARSMQKQQGNGKTGSC